MGDYINPFAGMDQAGGNENPMWAEMIRSDNARQRQPFIDQARERGDLELMKSRMEAGEFVGQEAQGVRSQQRRAEGSEAQYKIDTNPHRSKADQEKYRQELRALPDVTDERIAKARQATEQHRAGPHRELLSELGTAYDQMHGKGPDEQAQHYFNAVQRWQLGHPDTQLPEQYKRFDPAMIPDLAAIRHSQLYSPDQIGKERIVGMQNRSAEGIHAGTNAANIQIGAGHDAAHIRGAQVTRDASETPPRAIARLRRELRDKPDNEEARRELTGYLEEAFDKQKPDQVEQMYGIQATNSPEALQQYQVYREQRKARLFMNENLYGSIDGEGRNAVLKGIQLNPNMGMENVIDNLRKVKRKDGKNGLGQENKK